MEILIDIDEDIYNHIKNNYIVFNGMRTGKTFMAIIYNAIGKGTPLPKGHGKLIDADALNHELMDEYHGMISDSEMKIYKIMRMLDNASTIIESNKNEERRK